MHHATSRRWRRQAEHPLPLFDAPANRSPTSQAAAKSIVPHAPRLRDRVLAFLAGRGDRGATAEEISDALALRTNSTTARVNELVALRQAIDSGFTRVNSSGRRAIVWMAITPGYGESKCSNPSAR